MPDYAGLWSDIAAEVLPAMRDYRAAIKSVPIARKPDGTILSEADLAIQDIIIGILRRHDRAARIVAEESPNALAAADAAGPVWVVDPIDGTSQFIDPRLTEFCSVVALLEAGDPVACLILAPELGRGRTPVLITSVGAGKPPLVCGEPARPARRTQLVSVTRSSRAPVTPIEALAIQAGLLPKTGATSQTLDMARTALDLEPVTGLASFRWFAAAHQLLWDAAAGITLAKATGRMAVGEAGIPVFPIGAQIIADERPAVPVTLVATPDDVDWIFAHLRATAGAASTGAADA